MNPVQSIANPGHGNLTHSLADGLIISRLRLVIPHGPVQANQQASTTNGNAIIVHDLLGKLLGFGRL
jgi:hypothetical protein